MRKILDSLRIGLSMRNTINVNSILHGIRSLPFVGKYIPERIYAIRVFKILALIISVHVEIFKAFFGQLALFLFLFFSATGISSFLNTSPRTAFLYEFLGLSFVICLSTNLFGNFPETEYCVIHLGMDAKNYIIARLLYKSVNRLVTHVFFGIPAALFAGVGWYIAIFIPLSGLGFLVAGLGIRMAVYAAKQRAGKKMNRNGVPISIEGNSAAIILVSALIIIIGMIVTPAIVMFDLYPACVAVFVFSVLASVPGILLIRRFPYSLYRTAIFAEHAGALAVKEKSKKADRKKYEVKINESSGINGELKGYGFLNRLFVKRHGKVLNGRLIGTVIGTAVVIAGASIYLYYELKNFDSPTKSTLRYVFSRHPGIFPILLFFANSSANMAHAMFANCDSKMLMFRFYRTPGALLTMFRLRTVTAIGYNLVPAVMMSVFAVVVLALTGGEEYTLQYFFTVLEILISMSFFSLRHMTLYYLLQPYTSDFMLKNYVYAFFTFFTGALCFILVFIPLPASFFAVSGIVLGVVYFVISNIMVYNLAPKTFRVK